MSETTFSSAQELGYILLKDRIIELMRQDKKCREALIDKVNVRYSTTTNFVLIKDNKDQTWKQFTTLMNTPETLFVLEYALPCHDTNVLPHVTLSVAWRILHVGKQDAFRAAGLIEVPLTNVFVSASG